MFSGSGNDDYDLWWSKIRSKIFSLDIAEEDKVRAMNANLEGEARRYLETIDISKIVNTQQFHEILSALFSEKVNWHDRLNNCRQRTGEKVRAFSVRLRVTASKTNKCTNKDDLDQLCLIGNKLNKSNDQILD